MKIDVKRTRSLKNGVDYYIFDSKGNMLDLSYCDQIEVTVQISNTSSDVMKGLMCLTHLNLFLMIDVIHMQIVKITLMFLFNHVEMTTII